MTQSASQLIQQAQHSCGFSLREIGRRAGTSHATLSAYINNKKFPTTRTLLRILDACDVAVDMKLQRRIRSRNGLPRGEELAQVLRLAAQFPAHPAKRPKQPIFPG